MKQNFISILSAFVIIASIIFLFTPLRPQVSFIQPELKLIPTSIPIETEWKSYRSDKYGFEFKYPDNLILSVSNNVVNLRHFIKYPNSGDCDMSGGTEVFETLDDFNVSFEIKPKNYRSYEYVDGQYESGVLKGDYSVVGAEYCGDTEYYFPINGQTLMITRANIQALSGWSTVWNIKEILSIPGAISKEENAKIFKQILSTFKFNSPQENSTWKTYKNTQYGFEFQYPVKYKFINYGLYDNLGNNIYFLNIENNPQNYNLEKFESTNYQKCLKTPDESGEGCITLFLDRSRLSRDVILKNIPNLGEVYIRKNTPGIVDVDVTAWSRNHAFYYFSVISSFYSEEYNQILSTFKFTK